MNKKKCKIHENTSKQFSWVSIICTKIMDSGSINFLQICSNLKDYSVILTTSFYDINQKILTKKVISKVSVDPNFAFISYA